MGVAMSRPRIHLDRATFEPWKIQALTHSLSEHPLLQIDALVELGKRQQERNLVRTHSADATAGTSFADAPNLHPNKQGAVTTLSDDREGARVDVAAQRPGRPGLPQVHRRDPRRGAPAHRALEIQACATARVDLRASPNAITPFHMDHEHNFIMQIRGTKRLYTWDPFDRVVISERAQELFHDEHSRELVTWSEDSRSRARVFDLEPGLGGYMPSTAPHMVENGPEPRSRSASPTTRTRHVSRELLYRGNAQLRRLGLDPAPIGSSPQRDRVKHAVLSGYTQAKNMVRRALGKTIRENDQPYAPV